MIERNKKGGQRIVIASENTVSHSFGQFLEMQNVLSQEKEINIPSVILKCSYLQVVQPEVEIQPPTDFLVNTTYFISKLSK